MGLFKPNVEKLAQKSNVKGLVEALLYKKDPYVRSDAADALEKMETLDKIGDSKAIKLLVTALGDTDKLVKFTASRLLSRMGEKAVGPLVEAVTGDLGAMDYDKMLETRKEAARLLENIASPAAVDRLITSLGSADQTVRMSSAAALGGNNESRVIDALISRLDDKDYSAYGEVSRALGNIGDPRAVQPLIGVLQSGYSLKEVAEALGNIGDPRAVQPLIDTLETQAGKDHHWELPVSIIGALSKLGDTRAIEPLNSFLSHKSSYEKGSEVTRSYLARALGDIGDGMVAAVLTRTLNTDPYESIRCEAARALGKLAERGQLGSLAGIARISLKAASESDTLVVREVALKELDMLAKLDIDNADKIKEEIPIKEELPKKEEISIKDQISKYLNDYSDFAMIEELAKILVVLDKRSNREYESDKDAYETTLELIKYIGEKLNQKGGEGLMRQVLIQSGSFGCNTRFIEREWDGIGTWLG